MSLIKKSLIRLINFISVNTAILSIANAVKAEDYDIKLPSSSTTYQLKNQTRFFEAKFPVKFTSFSDSKVTHVIAADSSESRPTESGIPSLRRQPTGEEERFEPERIPLQIPFPKQPYRASPSITIINPSGYGASWGSAGIGLGYQDRVRFIDQADGVIGLGFGLGNSQKSLGAQVGISLVDVSSPFRDGAINLKLHRRLPQDSSVAIGVQGLTKWGDTDGGSSVYGVATKRFKLKRDRTKPFSEIYTTVGIGGGQFRSEADINNGNETVGVFGSLAIKVAQPVGFVAEWSGQDLTIGVPLVLFRRLPLVVVPALTDITGSAGDGARFIFGFGYSFSF
ncbi:hypothetical protein IQ255_23675 [Pleurocapsales cyanobacterium LEGE 10410]|nr:hypothetical protein [Pleurocapsales cyanobacterium LEGE 10410]